MNCRLEASSSGVDIYPSSENSNGHLSVENLSGDGAPRVEAHGSDGPSWSPTKANSNQVKFNLLLISHRKMLIKFLLFFIDIDFDHQKLCCF